MVRSIPRIGLFTIVLVVLLQGEHRSDGTEIRGYYIEARTCDVFTGPCFANGEVGLAGKEAVMGWAITSGRQNDIDLAGLSVVVVVRAENTLGFEGLEGAGTIKSMFIVDERANLQQRKALVQFAKSHAGNAGKCVVCVVAAPIDFSLNTKDLTGSLTAGKWVDLATRKAGQNDCICSNESAYYPPLVKVNNFAAGVTTEGRVIARALGTTWSIPQSRSAYMATFSY